MPHRALKLILKLLRLHGFIHPHLLIHAHIQAKIFLSIPLIIQTPLRHYQAEIDSFLSNLF